MSWQATTFGFFSIVKKGGNNNGDGEFQIRARTRGDLKNLIAKADLGGKKRIIETFNSDYRFRIIVDAEQLDSVFEAIKKSITYGNFKSAVSASPGQGEHAHLYHKVWGTMANLQDSKPYSGTDTKSLFKGDWYQETFGHKPVVKRDNDEKKISHAPRNILHRVYDVVAKETGKERSMVTAFTDISQVTKGSSVVTNRFADALQVEFKINIATLDGIRKSHYPSGIADYVVEVMRMQGVEIPKSKSLTDVEPPKHAVIKTPALPSLDATLDKLAEKKAARSKRAVEVGKRVNNVKLWNRFLKEGAIKGQYGSKEERSRHYATWKAQQSHEVTA